MNKQTKLYLDIQSTQVDNQQVKNYMNSTLSPQNSTYAGTSQFYDLEFDSFDEYNLQSYRQNNDLMDSFEKCKINYHSKGIYSMDSIQEQSFQQSQQYSNNDQNALFNQQDPVDIPSEEGQYQLQQVINEYPAQNITEGQQNPNPTSLEESQMQYESQIELDVEQEIQQPQPTLNKKGSTSRKQTISYNKKGKKSCQETKNLFVLSIHFIFSRLRDQENGKSRWEYVNQIQSLEKVDKKMNSLRGFNKVISEVYQKSEGNPDIIYSFKECINEILDYDYVKYALNQKNDITQYVFLKYVPALRVMANNKPKTFNSIKQILNEIKKRS